MHFIDEVKIYCKAGDGGNGCCSFRREKYVEFGGPDGGNGGKGGSIVFVAVENLNTLVDFRYTQHFKAKKGGHGKGANRTGASGADLVIEVPVGTQILSEDSNYFIEDMDVAGKEFTLLEGGESGKGNAHFKSSVNRAPRKVTTGRVGEEIWVWLKLKLLSDVGIIGLPNAGKSTLLSIISAARPKIADYPFTTLIPNLGVVDYKDKSFCVADIPGLIEGASHGHGLGDRFLKHIERCKILVHLVDVTSKNILHDIEVVQNELELFSEELPKKPVTYVLNKVDMIADEEELENIKQTLEEKLGKKFLVNSSVNKKYIESILAQIVEELENL